MSTENKGEPAFPCAANNAQAPWDGMTLRDYFAAKAMVGLMGRSWDEVNQAKVIEIWATSAYGIADAMLAAREKPAS